jgi:hypothetical protein
MPVCIRIGGSSEELTGLTPISIPHPNQIRPKRPRQNRIVEDDSRPNGLVPTPEAGADDDGHRLLRHTPHFCFLGRKLEVCHVSLKEASYSLSRSYLRRMEKSVLSIFTRKLQICITFF